MVMRSTTARAEKEFDIAVAAGDRRGKYTDVDAAERRRERGDVVANFPMHRRVAYDSALGMFSCRLELRFYQREESHRRRRQRQRHRQHGLERNETDVNHDDVRPYWQAPALKGSNIGVFHGNDFGVVAQRGMQLA